MKAFHENGTGINGASFCSSGARCWKFCRQVVAGRRRDAMSACHVAEQAGWTHLMELDAQVNVFKSCLPCLAHKAVLSPLPHLQVDRCG